MAICPCCFTKTRVTQVYCSPLPVAYSGMSAAEWAGLTSLILKAANEVVVLWAALNAACGGSRRLLLTRAVGNEGAWIKFGRPAGGAPSRGAGVGDADGQLRSAERCDPGG